jgi:hypothetical protein
MVQVRGKEVMVSRHAFDGMNAENPPIRVEDVEAALINPDSVQGNKSLKWTGRRTVIVYSNEYPDYIEVESVSATRRKLV